MNKTTNKYSPELRERSVRMVLDNQGQHEIRWTAIVSISSKISDFTYVATWQGFATLSSSSTYLPAPPDR